MKSAYGFLLVVDDDEMNRDVLSRRLIRQGYTVKAAQNGKEALELIEKCNFDLVLLDIAMPDIDGVQVLQTLRQRYSPIELPIIMVTAKQRSEDVAEALNAGANDYVTKPIDFNVALARIQNQLSRKPPEDEAYRVPTVTGENLDNVGTGDLTVQSGAGSLLVVDDDEMNRDVLSRRLIRQGYTVKVAQNGREALELIEKCNFDLILLDIAMPDVDGVQVLYALRQRYSPIELPIIMVTAKQESEYVAGGLSAGANDYVTKPIDFKVALARIQNQLSRKPQ